jgi:hypothetical protein
MHEAAICSNKNIYRHGALLCICHYIAEYYSIFSSDLLVTMY